MSILVALAAVDDGVGTLWCRDTPRYRALAFDINIYYFRFYDVYDECVAARAVQLWKGNDRELAEFTLDSFLFSK